MSRDVDGKELTEREEILLFTDDPCIIGLSVEEVAARGRKLGNLLYSNCPATFAEAAIDEFNRLGHYGDRGG